MGGGSAQLRAALPGHAARRAPRPRSATTSTSCTSRAATSSRTVPASSGAARGTRRRSRRRSRLAVDLYAGLELAGDVLDRDAPRRRACSSAPPTPSVAGARTSRSGVAGSSRPTSGGCTLHARPGRRGPGCCVDGALVARRRHRPAAGRAERSSASGARRCAADGRPRRAGQRDRARRRVLERGARPCSSGVQVGCRARAARPTCSNGRSPRPRRADAVVVVVGTNDDWESEGHDREIDGPARRPGRARRARARGEPRHRRRGERGVAGHDGVGRPAPARRSRCWFGGQEMANALADVLFGEAEPGGRLPDHVPGPARAQPVVRQLPGRERRDPLRRGRARRLPLVRRARTCRRGSRSATACRTRRSRSARPGCRRPTFAAGRRR